jgi:hypothetical protein
VRAVRLFAQGKPLYAIIRDDEIAQHFLNVSEPQQLRLNSSGYGTRWRRNADVFQSRKLGAGKGFGRRLRHSLNMRGPTRLRQGKFAKAANEKPRPMRIKGRGLLSLGEIDVLGETSCPNPTIGFAGNNSQICNLLCRADPLGLCTFSAPTASARPRAGAVSFGATAIEKAVGIGALRLAGFEN